MNSHQRAQSLILSERVEGITSADQSWLQAHLNECQGCASIAASTHDTIQSLRSAPVMARPGLVHATQMLVRLRAQQLSEQRLRAASLWVACAVAAFWTVITTTVMWHGFAWVGAQFSLPETGWQLLFVLTWVVPSFAVAVSLLFFLPNKAALAGKMSGFGRTLEAS